MATPPSTTKQRPSDTVENPHSKWCDCTAQTHVSGTCDCDIDCTVNSPACDREIMRAMLVKAGIVCEEHPTEKFGAACEFIVEEGKGPKNVGDSGFIACFFFDADGNLKAVGAWE